MRLHRSFAAVALSALIAAPIPVLGPLLASPVMAQDGGRQTLNVQGADIRAFIQDVARTTGRTFIVDPAVTGTVTVTSQRALSRSELFEVFLSTLRANGLVVTPTSSGAYRISPAQGAAQGPSTVGSERFSPPRPPRPSGLWSDPRARSWPTPAATASWSPTSPTT
jgi:general secretion pathway protein D